MSEPASTLHTSPARALGVNDLIKSVLELEITSKEKKRLIDEIRKNSPALNDRRLYRWVVWFLGAKAVLSVVGFVVILSLDDEIPEGLVALGSAAVGGLAGMFTSSSQQDLESK
jgi:hypothetical protein